MEARHIPFMLMCISLGYSDIQILLFSLRLNIAFFAAKFSPHGNTCKSACCGWLLLVKLGKVDFLVGLAGWCE